jgi:hypothetical protein
MLLSKLPLYTRSSSFEPFLCVLTSFEAPQRKPKRKVSFVECLLFRSVLFCSVSSPQLASINMLWYKKWKIENKK